MIYNIAQLLRDQFPSEIFYVNGRIRVAGNEIEDRNVLLNETGGTEQALTRYTKATIQIVARDVDNVKSRALAYDIHNYIQSRFGLILPSTVVDTVTIPEIKVAAITAIQIPQNIGNDPEGRIEYSANYEIILG